MVQWQSLSNVRIRTQPMLLTLLVSQQLLLQLPILKTVGKMLHFTALSTTKEGTPKVSSLQQMVEELMRHCHLAQTVLRLLATRWQLRKRTGSSIRQEWYLQAQPAVLMVTERLVVASDQSRQAQMEEQLRHTNSNSRLSCNRITSILSIKMANILAIQTIPLTLVSFQ
jgi:hypothetical protein